MRSSLEQHMRNTYNNIEHTDNYSGTSEQRTHWEQNHCPLLGGCPYLGGSH